MKKHNALTGKMEKPMTHANNGKAIVPLGTVKSASNWLRKNKKSKDEN